ncbi:glycosyltransferase [Vibrio fortis]|uniref:glycosyltransferase n=1 Tax=Vibrio fortis TaxID=212667 RepID=UPI003EBFFA81
MKIVTPLVSVIITTFNRVDLLKRAIESVLEQDYPNIEIIIADDCSTDATGSVVKELMKVHENLFYCRTSTNSGANVARNLAISNSKGYYITGLDDDDYFSPNRVSSLVDSFDPDKFSFVCSNFTILAPSKSYVRFRKVDTILSYKDILVENLAGTQVLTTRKRLIDIGCYDESLKRLQDMDTFLRLTLKFGDALRLGIPSYYIDETHDGQRITTSVKEFDAYYDFFQKHKESMPRSYYLTNLIRLNSYGLKKEKLALNSISEIFSVNFIPSFKVLIRRCMGRLS